MQKNPLFWGGPPFRNEASYILLLILFYIEIGGVCKKIELNIFKIVWAIAILSLKIYGIFFKMSEFWPVCLNESDSSWNSSSKVEFRISILFKVDDADVLTLILNLIQWNLKLEGH